MTAENQPTRIRKCSDTLSDTTFFGENANADNVDAANTSVLESLVFYKQTSNAKPPTWPLKINQKKSENVATH